MIGLPRETKRERVIDILKSEFCPICVNTWTFVLILIRPNSMQTTDRAGAQAFFYSADLTQSAYFRFHNRSEDIKNLYLVGAGTHPGAGVPGVLSSAKVVEHLLKEDFPQPTGAML